MLELSTFDKPILNLSKILISFAILIVDFFLLPLNDAAYILPHNKNKRKNTTKEIFFKFILLLL